VLAERWGWTAAAGVSSLVFALLHGANPSVSPVALGNTFLLGLALALLVRATGSLLAAVVAHGVWNWAGVCLVSLPISGLEGPSMLDTRLAGAVWITGGDYGPEGSWLLTGLSVVLVGVLLMWAERAARGRDAATANPF
jgi:hypothetical protein